MSTLVLERISKTFGGSPVLDEVTISVPDRSFICLLGPSGCGKTTLLRIVAGLESPTAGKVTLGDRVLWDRGVNVSPEKRGFAMVFQSYAVWPHMTVYENVAYPLRIRRVQKAEREKRVRGALELVHLDDLKDRFPHQLSGGQQQRVALARGIVMEPPVFLLDEPLSNLDAKLRSQMRRELKELHRALQITMLYVTHDQKEAFEMATRIVILNEGRVEQEGTPAEIRTSPAPGFVQEFLSEG
jgi:iron(III) transport system ATP-binding protein